MKYSKTLEDKGNRNGKENQKLCRDGHQQQENLEEATMNTDNDDPNERFDKQESMSLAPIRNHRVKKRRQSDDKEEDYDEVEEQKNHAQGGVNRMTKNNAMHIDGDGDGDSVEEHEENVAHDTGGLSEQMKYMNMNSYGEHKRAVSNMQQRMGDKSDDEYGTTVKSPPFANLPETNLNADCDILFNNPVVKSSVPIVEEDKDEEELDDKTFISSSPWLLFTPPRLSLSSCLSSSKNIQIPGPFVVFQGTPGDGMRNTIDYTPSDSAVLSRSRKSRSFSSDCSNDSEDVDYNDLDSSSTFTDKDENVHDDSDNDDENDNDEKYDRDSEGFVFVTEEDNAARRALTEDAIEGGVILSQMKTTAVALAQETPASAVALQPIVRPFRAQIHQKQQISCAQLSASSSPSTGTAAISMSSPLLSITQKTKTSMASPAFSSSMQLYSIMNKNSKKNHKNTTNDENSFNNSNTNRSAAILITQSCNPTITDVSSSSSACSATMNMVPGEVEGREKIRSKSTANDRGNADVSYNEVVHFNDDDSRNDYNDNHENLNDDDNDDDHSIVQQWNEECRHREMQQYQEWLEEVYCQSDHLRRHHLQQQEQTLSFTQTTSNNVLNLHNGKSHMECHSSSNNSNIGINDWNPCWWRNPKNGELLVWDSVPRSKQQVQVSREQSESHTPPQPTITTTSLNLASSSATLPSFQQYGASNFNADNGFQYHATSATTATTEATIISSLAPGMSIIGTELITVDSNNFEKIIFTSSSTAPSSRSSQSAESKSSRSWINLFPHGKQGWTQFLKIEEPPIIRNSQQNQQTGFSSRFYYVVYSIDGYNYIGPGCVDEYVQPSCWYWRVVAKDGAYVRSGLDLSTSHIATIPYGSIVQVLQKTINVMGLSRLLIRGSVAVPITTNSKVETVTASAGLKFQRLCVEGWCSEYLNPLSGQRGRILHPIPFPVPAIYTISCPEGAIVRDGIELSSTAIRFCDSDLSNNTPTTTNSNTNIVRTTETRLAVAEAESITVSSGSIPPGTLVTCVGRVFAENPIDRCIERLKLAPLVMQPTQTSVVGGGTGCRSFNATAVGGGYISVRLNLPSPYDTYVTKFHSIDSTFDPINPGQYYLRALRRLQQQKQAPHRLYHCTQGMMGEQYQHRRRRRQSRQRDLRHGIVITNSTIQCQSQRLRTTMITTSEDDKDNDENDTFMMKSINQIGKDNINTNSCTMDSSGDRIVQSLSDRISKSKNNERNMQKEKKTRKDSNARRKEHKNNICLICLSSERTATIVHGDTGHIACCLFCARILKARDDPCPVCRLRIDSVIQHFYA